MAKPDKENGSEYASKATEQGEQYLQSREQGKGEQPGKDLAKTGQSPDLAVQLCQASPFADNLAPVNDDLHQ